MKALAGESQMNVRILTVKRCPLIVIPFANIGSISSTNIASNILLLSLAFLFCNKYQLPLAANSAC